MIIISSDWKARLGGILIGTLAYLVGLTNVVSHLYVVNRFLVCYIGAGLMVAGIIIALIGLIVGHKLERKGMEEKKALFQKLGRNNGV